MDARKVRFDRPATLKLARAATRVISIRGQQSITFDMLKNPPADDQLAKALLGPTGNLRAPALRHRHTLIVGFSPQAYKSETSK